MAVQRTQINNHRRKPVIHLWASAAGDSSTILLTELLMSDETSSSSVSLQANIAQAYCNVADNGTSGIIIRRGTSSGTVVLDMHGQSEYPQQLQWPALAMNNTSSIFVYWQQPGLVVLELHKVAGFIEPLTNVGV